MLFQINNNNYCYFAHVVNPMRMWYNNRYFKYVMSKLIYLKTFMSKPIHYIKSNSHNFCYFFSPNARQLVQIIDNFVKQDDENMGQELKINQLELNSRDKVIIIGLEKNEEIINKEITNGLENSEREESTSPLKSSLS